IRTKEALVRATTELVAEVGYHQATTRAIAERAGVSEGTIYRHFPDKRSLFAAAVMAHQPEVTDWFSNLPALAGTGTVPMNLVQAFTRLSELRSAVIPLETALAASPDLAQHLAPASGLTQTEAQIDIGQQIAQRGGPPTMLLKYLNAEQVAGRIRGDLDLGRMLAIVLISFYGLQTSPLAGSDGVDEVTIADFVALMLHGLQASP
ncbi:MAG: helix-turn-helix domain-containing protein, partial [Ornithinimicrobium sp.]